MSVPMQQMRPMGEEQEAPEAPEQEEMEVNQLSDADEQDADIAYARAVEYLQNPQEGQPDGMEVLTKTLSGRNPEQQLAMFYAQMIEAINTEAQEAGLELNPVIWFADGGVVDRFADKIEDLLGGEFDIQGMMPAVKDKLREILSQRGQQLKAQMEGQQGQQGQPQPGQPPQQGAQDERPPLLSRG